MIESSKRLTVMDASQHDKTLLNDISAIGEDTTMNRNATLAGLNQHDYGRTTMPTVAIVVAAMISVVLCRYSTAEPVGANTDIKVSSVAQTQPELINPRFECRRAPKPIVIDGDLSEWVELPAIVLDSKEYAHDKEGKWQGPKDCSGSIRLCYDAENLYLAFDVTDDKFFQRHTGRAIWLGDCVRFAFDSLEDRYEGKYLFDDYRVTAALTTQGPQLWCSGGAFVGPMQSQLAIVEKHTGDGMIYELAIPWAQLDPLAPIMRRTFGFSFNIYDHDGAEKQRFKSWLAWTPGITGGKNPAALGQVLLQYEPPEDNKTEVFVSTDIPQRPDVTDIIFRIARSGQADENLTVKMELSADDETVAASQTIAAFAGGVSARKVTWPIHGIADGTYQGKLTISADGKELMHRSFSYMPMMTGPVRDRIDATRKRFRNLRSKQGELWDKSEPSVAYRIDAAEKWLRTAENFTRR